MQRFGQVIGIKPEYVEDYERLHQVVWPEVLSMIHECNMRNYSIFRHGDLLFAYFEYIGDDYEADMGKMSADPKTQEWWGKVGSMQEPLSDRSPTEWWKTIPEVFHTE